MSRPLLAALLAVPLLVFLIAVANSSREAQAAPVIGSGSCVPGACDGLGSSAVIGRNSCTVVDSCDGLTGQVGNNSCNASSACLNFSGTAGNGSCNGPVSCATASGNFGNNSCNATQACVSSLGTIGDNSCNATRACPPAYRVGDNSCNAEEICTEERMIVGDCQLNAGDIPPACVERPNIGAGLSGLFRGQPTPLPTVPSAAAPAATSPITPPRTGDGGLR